MLRYEKADLGVPTTEIFSVMPSRLSPYYYYYYYFNTPVVKVPGVKN